MNEISISEKLIAQFEAIRKSGKTNMLSKGEVQRIAYENQFYELVNAIKKDYGEILEKHPKVVDGLDEEDIPEMEET